MPTKSCEGDTISLADHDVGLLTGIWLVQLITVRLYLAWEAGREVEDCAAPEWSLLEGFEIETRYYAEIVASAAEGLPQVRVFLCVCIDGSPLARTTS